MPFIPMEQRREAREQFAAGKGIQEAGELSYIVADAIDSFVGGRYGFARLAQVEGAVQAALDQFKLQVLNPYEEGKRRQNGHVFLLSTVSEGGPNE